MRLSTLRTRSLGLVLAGAVGALLVACGDAPTDPAPQFGHIGGGEGHPTPPTIEFIAQPEVIPHQSGISLCRIEFSFMLENGKGRVSFWTVWMGGDHDGQASQVRDPATTVVIDLAPASKFNGMETFGMRFHAKDDHSFEALKIQVRNHRNEVLAEANSAAGGTSSC